MKYFLWRLFKQGFWMKLKSHYESHGIHFYAEWQQKKGITKDHFLYKLIGTPEGAVAE